MYGLICTILCLHRLNFAGVIYKCTGYLYPSKGIVIVYWSLYHVSANSLQFTAFS